MGDQTSIKFLELANGCACEALDRPIKKKFVETLDLYLP